MNKQMLILTAIEVLAWVAMAATTVVYIPAILGW
jgi:hypothetical protein